MDLDKLLRPVLGLAMAGLVGIFLAPVVLPAIARVARPAAKGALKAGLIMAARGRETLAELGEMAEDMLAEIQSELAAETAAKTAAAAPAASQAGAVLMEPTE